ncbi:unnamed protein product [marine sediment metagenome]|uniref:Uncharacterized protein n=1 Tax=marine sediment metagenome TaxID=412755 RepID=X1PNE1_9ZZZZ
MIKWMDAPGHKCVESNDMPAEWKMRLRQTATGTDGKSLQIEWKFTYKTKRANADATTTVASGCSGAKSGKYTVEFDSKTDELPKSKSKS